MQIRILPLLATTFALHYTGEYFYELYNKSRSTIEEGDFGPLAELHSASSGLKSLCTTLAADGIETCRRAMGGHGFGGGSGLIGLNSDYLSKPTVEGDNWMITQQVAAYLIKKMQQCVEKPERSSKDPTDELFKLYLIDRDHKIPQSYLNPASKEIDDASIVSIFQWRAAALSYTAYQQRIEQKKPWTKMMIQLHALSRAYSEQILVTNFHNALTSAHSHLASPTSAVLRTCFRLYALYTMEQSSTSFLLHSYILSHHAARFYTRAHGTAASARSEAGGCMVDSRFLA